MEQNNDIIVYGQNGEIVDCKFQRVDFSNPQTILNYCNDVKEQIASILDTTAQMAMDNEEIQIDETLIASLTSFDDSLTESEVKKQKEAKQHPLIKGIKSVLSSMGVKKAIDDQKLSTYQGRYEQYCKVIEQVCIAVNTQKEGALADINLRNAIVAELVPYIEELEQMIKVGYLDKEAYDKETEVLKESLPNQDVEYEIQYRTQLSEVFNGKLTELTKALVLFKEQIQSYRLQQRTDMELVMTADSYLKDSAPIMKAQGSVIVFNRLQENRIRSMSQLTEATNQAIVSNARKLEQNAAGAVELSLNKGIHMETLSALDESLRRGVEIFKAGHAQLQDKIAQDRDSLVRMNESLQDFQREVLQLIEEGTAMSEFIKNQSNDDIGRKRKLG